MRLWQWQQPLIGGGNRASMEFMQYLLSLAGEVNETAADVAASTARVTSNVGPYYVHNIFPSTTMTMQSLFSTGTSTVNREGVDFAMPRAGRVIGAYLMSSVACVGGAATLDVTVNGVAVATPTIRINLTNPRTTSILGDYASGIAFAAGDTVGAQIVTDAGWSPSTADLQATLIVAFDNV